MLFRSVFPLESRFSKLSTPAANFAFKGWVFSPPCKEIGKGRLKMPQSLLKGHRANFIQKREVVLLLPPGQHYRGFVIPNARSIFVPSLGPKRECFVVDKPCTADRSPQQVFLFSRWIESVFERPKFHCYILVWLA